jgi:hypothetical protein
MNTQFYGGYVLGLSTMSLAIIAFHLYKLFS